MKSLKEQKLNKCRHFNGTMNKTCEAGVSYDAVIRPNPSGQGKLLPCFKDSGNGEGCDKCQFKTEAEVDAEVEAARQSFVNAMLARKAIVDHLGGPWKKGMGGARGAIECPVCHGTLLYSRAGYNGHIHAQCETPNCVSWME